MSSTESDNTDWEVKAPQKYNKTFLGQKIDDNEYYIYETKRKEKKTIVQKTVEAVQDLAIGLPIPSPQIRYKRELHAVPVEAFVWNASITYILEDDDRSHYIGGIKYTPVSQMEKQGKIERDFSQLDEKAKTVKVHLWPTRKQFKKEEKILGPEGIPAQEIHVNLDKLEDIEETRKKGNVYLFHVKGNAVIQIPSGETFCSKNGVWKQTQIFDYQDMPTKKETIVDAEILALKEEIKELKGKNDLLHEKLEKKSEVIPEKEKEEEYIVDFLQYTDPPNAEKDTAKLMQAKGWSQYPAFDQNKHEPDMWFRGILDALRSCNAAGSAIPTMIILKLDVESRVDLGEFTNPEMSLAEFRDIFLRQFGKGKSPIQMLATMWTRIMKQDEVLDEKFNQFYILLQREAHDIYRMLNISNKYWSVCDSVLVVQNLIKGLPKNIAEYVIQKGSTTVNEILNDCKIFMSSQKVSATTCVSIGNVSSWSGVNGTTSKREEEKNPGEKKSYQRKPPKCNKCVQTGEYCKHCLKCGSDKHKIKECSSK